MQEVKLKNNFDKRELFLLLFTKEILKNSMGGMLHLRKVIESEEKNRPQIKQTKSQIKTEDRTPLIKSILSQEPKPNEELSVLAPVRIKPHRKEISGKPQEVFKYPPLKIPEPKLPVEFQYLRPIPTRKEIDLGKLNPLINDPAVQIIECEGPDKPIIVSGAMGRKPTPIILSNEDIEDIISKFSSASKIPVDVGVFKVVVGRLIFSAIISDVVPSRFIIRKMKFYNTKAVR